MMKAKCLYSLFLIFSLFITLLCPTACCATPHYNYVGEDVWKQIEPYLIPDNHPIKRKLDSLFSKQRFLANRDTLTAAGFEKKNHEPRTKIFALRNKHFPGYFFKLYTDDKLSYYRDEPEYIAWMLRARGAKLVREMIDREKWHAYFKAPKKWIYPLPPNIKARRGHLQKNFILVEEEMDLLPDNEIRAKWHNGFITTKHLDMLFYLVTHLGLRGGCKYDNIPICKDGKLAFIDTQNNLRWPLPYDRMFAILEGELREYWKKLMHERAHTIPRI